LTEVIISPTEHDMFVRPEQSRWSRSIIIALFLFFLPACLGISFADQTTPGSVVPDTYPPLIIDQVSPAPSSQPAPPLLAAESALPPEPEPAPEFNPLEEPPTTGYMTAIGKAMDVAHASLERGILGQELRFDKFFGTVNTEGLRQTKYELRWRNAFRVEHGWDLLYGTSIRAHFTLSRISEKLRLVIAGEDEPGVTRQTLPQDPGSPGFDRTTPAAHFANTELRYDLLQTPSIYLFLGAGVRVSLPFEAFLRSRFQYTTHLNEITLMRVAETFFVKNSDLLGETTEFSFERLLGQHTIIRWASAGTASEEIEGVEWGTELSLLRELSPKSAITLTGGLYGVTSTAGLISNYRILARYRRNFLRKWLFYELEPEVNWPRDVDGKYPATLAITFRFEVVFQGADTGTGPNGAASSSALRGRGGEK
jgi:hypothetical protein